MGLMRRLVSSWRALSACERGSPAVEFAFIAPPLCLILVGIIEVALVIAGNILLEGAVRQAARYGITGYVPAGTTRIAYMTQIITQNTAGLINTANLVITYQVYSSFSNVHQPEPYIDQNGNGVKDGGEPFTDINGNATWDTDMGVAGLGGPGDIVAYTISYNWPVITNLMKPILGGADQLLKLKAEVVVRNEPF
jgi:Flp pilus assembly protein TadG